LLELKDLLQQRKKKSIDAGIIMVMYASLGDRDNTFLWMEKAYAERSLTLASFKINPLFDLVRPDPRFQEMVHRIF
jgi:hypothetical protein